jgi:hypothetical protein
MDNLEQVRQIRRYRRYLFRATGIVIDPDTAARLWIRRYARLWRRLHPCSIRGAEAAHVKPA